MKKKVRWAVMVIFFIMFISMCGCSGSDEKGACVRETGVSPGCTNGVTSGECSMVNGTFYEGDSCSDLGFDSV